MCHRQNTNDSFFQRGERLRLEAQAVLQFTALLYENTYSRTIYASLEHVVTLLECASLTVVNCALRALYVFTRRSTLLMHCCPQMREQLADYLNTIAEVVFRVKVQLQFHIQSWGGRSAGVTLAQCSRDGGGVILKDLLPIAYEYGDGSVGNIEQEEMIRVGYLRQ